MPIPRRAVPTAANGYEQIVIASEAYRGDDVGRIRASRNQTRTLVDHRIVNFAGIFIG